MVEKSYLRLCPQGITYESKFPENKSTTVSKRNTLNKVQQVADVEYPCGSNHTCCMVMLIPEALEIKVGDDVEVAEFCINSKDWFDTILPQWLYGLNYTPKIGETSVKVKKIRDRRDEDVCVNDDEPGI